MMYNRMNSVVVIVSVLLALANAFVPKSTFENHKKIISQFQFSQSAEPYRASHAINTRRTSKLFMSVDILERPDVKKKENVEKKRQFSNRDGWEVRIYNDASNTREFVARCLVTVVKLSEFVAYQTMMQAHQNGVAVVGAYTSFEEAEMYFEGLRGNGIVCDLIPVSE